MLYLRDISALALPTAGVPCGISPGDFAHIEAVTERSAAAASVSTSAATPAQLRAQLAEAQAEAKRWQAAAMKLYTASVEDALDGADAMQS